MDTLVIPGLSLADAAVRRSGSVDASVFDGVAPPGWERSIRRMKRDKSITNPWALAWWMRRRGAQPSQKDTEEDGAFDAAVQAALAANPHEQFPKEYLAAAKGELWAQSLLMQNNLPRLLVK